VTSPYRRGSESDVSSLPSYLYIVSSIFDIINVG
jgi:hypothetical protein